MATAAVNLSVPAPADDSMEMSSPGHHNLDEDIDFDDYQPDGGGVAVNDEDRMMDDGEHTRPATATDDMMEDDMQQGEQTEVHEEVMEDSPSHVQPLEDEELIDYSDDEVQDEIVEDAIAPDAEEQSQVTAPVANLQENYVEETVHTPNETAAEHEQATQDFAEVAAVAEEVVLPTSPEGEKVVPQETSSAEGQGDGQFEEAALEPPSGDIQEQAADADEERADGASEEPAVIEDVDAHKRTISLDTSAQPVVDGPATPTDTGLHPMTVRFGDSQFPLFKSRNQSDGLLKNDNIASLSLGELIQNCRQRLAIKTGEPVSDEEVLVLGFDQFGLILLEDSRAAFDCSLNEVLDVYLRLHRNDNTQDIPPFSLSLSLQVRFASSISVLKQAAAGGEGMSSFTYGHSSEEQVGDYDEHAQEEYEAGRQEERHQDGEATEDQQYQEASQVEGSIPEQNEANTNEYYGESQEYQEYAGQEEYYHEDENHQDQHGEDQYYEDNQDEATQLLDDHALEGENHVEESGEAACAAPDGQAALLEDFKASAEEDKNASTATSITFQGDDGQDVAGEYSEEDLIDWDDDSNLTSDPSEQAAASNVDFSTLLEDNGEDGRDDSFNADAHQQHGLDHAATHEGTDVQDNDELAQPEFDTQNLGSEDYLGESQEQAHDQDHAGHEEGHGAYEQEYDQADADAEQQGDFNHPDYPLGEEEDQFHTAYDLFDGEDQEHGPEHTASNNDADETTLVASAADDKQQHGDTEDFIDFDIDDEPTVDERAQKLNVADTGSRTPLAKRSFEDLAGDEIDFDSPEPKKARAS